VGAQITVTYPFGSTVRFTCTFTDPTRTDAPVDPSTGNTLVDPTTVTAKLKKPDGSITTKVYGTDVEVVRDDVGIYHMDVAGDASGSWVIGWIGTGALPAQRELAFKVEATAF
jgi:hypothetical protein